MTPIQKKLQIKDGMIGTIFNAPANLDAGSLVSEEHHSRKKAGLDWVITFVASRRDVEKYTKRTLRCVQRDGLIWFCYPKKTSGVETDLTRDHGWEPVFEAGLRGVRQIAIDAIWSGIRFRYTDLVR